jgi:hypothetical protein
MNIPFVEELPRAKLSLMIFVTPQTRLLIQQVK